jgi:hypothetical protein
MNRQQKTFAALAIALASMTAHAQDPAPVVDRSHQDADGSTMQYATQADRAEAQSAAQADDEAGRVDRSVIARAVRRERSFARHAAPVTNDAVLADGVTIDGGS